MTESSEAAKRVGKPLWMEYVDLGAKILLPIAVLGGTLLFNSSQASLSADREDRRGCLDNQFKLVALPKDAEHALSDTLWEAINAQCASAGLRPFRRTVQRVAATTADAGTFGRTTEALGATLSTPQPASASAPAPVIDERPTSTGPRVYIQIQREDQRPAAQELRAALNASTFNGRQLLAPGVELPANPRARVATTELRCAGDDCEQAPLLASYIASLLNRSSIPVRDISALQGAGNARPGHYELWFGPEALSGASAAPQASQAPPPASASTASKAVQYVAKFNLGRYTLDDEAAAAVTAAAAAAKRNSSLVNVVGRDDTSGESRTAAQRRANVVMQALIDRGVPSQVLTQGVIYSGGAELDRTCFTPGQAPKRSVTIDVCS